MTADHHRRSKAPRSRAGPSARSCASGWALEEVGQPYDVRLLSFAAMKL